MTHPTPSDQPAMPDGGLLDCPFCGGRAIEHRVPGLGQLWKVSCAQCDAAPNGSFSAHNAVKRWNTRAPVEQTAPDRFANPGKAIEQTAQASEEERMREALAALESACDGLAANRSQETYLRMIDVDQAEPFLQALDDARRHARAALSPIPTGTDAKESSA